MEQEGEAVKTPTTLFVYLLENGRSENPNSDRRKNVSQTLKA
jgi:hypothetical protein